MHSDLRSVALFMTIFLLVSGSPCWAQTNVERPITTNSAVLLAVNAALGGATAGIGRALHGKPVRRGVAGGALAGVVVFSGKWVASGNRDATNLVGRSIAAVGSSGIRNAAADQPLLSDVALAYGPMRFHIARENRYRPRVKLDLATSIVMIHEFGKSEQEFEAARSAVAGVPIFRVDSSKRSGAVGGSQIAGVVTYRTASRYESTEPARVKRMIGHELVHVIQSDALFNTYAAPLEKKLFTILPLGRTLHRYVDIGVHVPVWSGVNSMVAYRYRPWEWEARTLAGK